MVSDPVFQNPLHDLPVPDRLAIGVSGGADSMALLHMLQQHRKTHIIALTVDHRLRADSATEAQQVAAYCAAQGVTHHILNWDNAGPQTGLQNKARNARRTLLLEQCHAMGIADLFLAHQADDQLETMLQRLARGAGLNGLKAMRPQTVQQNIRIHRPLLAVRRADLRAYCTAHSIPFCDDPSNDDPRFERIRWRQAVARLETAQPGFATGLLRSQTRLAKAAHALGQCASTWIAQHVQKKGDAIHVPYAALQAQPEALIVEIVRQLMVTDKAHTASLERLEEWVAQAFGGQVPAETALTLDGWWLSVTKTALTLRKAPPRRHKID